MLIKRSQSTVSSIFSLFMWLDLLENKEILILNGTNSKLVPITKQESDVIKLDFDFRNLENKFYEWYFSKQSTWCLNESESIVFMKSCRAAFFYLGEQNYNIGSNRQKISDLYNQYFNKVEEDNH